MQQPEQSSQRGVGLHNGLLPACAVQWAAGRHCDRARGAVICSSLAAPRLLAALAHES